MFDHYVALDWAMCNMALARMTKKSNKISVIDVPANIKDLILYLKNLKGKICLTFEETTTSQWLYCELKEYVEKVIVCDPYRNKLLSEGAKTDKIDASKLVQLLKADLLKEVYHSNDKFIRMRKIVSAYDDVIKAGIRAKNQRSALFRAVQKNHKNKEDKLVGTADQFVEVGLDLAIENYEKEKERYKAEFRSLIKKHSEIKRISEIPGIAEVRSVQIVSRVVDAHRFPTRNNFLSYCGLIKLEKMSGGRSYGKKNPRYCRMMKCIFKMGVLSVIGKNNPLNDYYEYLQNKKNYSVRDAKSAVARRLATLVYGVMKSRTRYEPYRKRKNDVSNVNADL